MIVDRNVLVSWEKKVGMKRVKLYALFHSSITSCDCLGGDLTSKDTSSTSWGPEGLEGEVRVCVIGGLVGWLVGWFREERECDRWER